MSKNPQRNLSFRQLPILDKILAILIGFLPWSIFSGIFFGNVLHIPGVNFIKELLLALVAALVGWQYYQRKLIPKFDLIDMSALSFVVILTAISLFNNLSLGHYFYGGRYDFEWIFALILLKHTAPLLSWSYARFMNIFFWSGGIALALGIFIRFVVGVDALLYFGYGANLSNWTLGGQIPIYHGVEGANVQRFQGIFDGPNPAGAFLLLYIPLYVAYFLPRKSYHYLASLGGIVLIITLFYTYSRSAVLGLIVASAILAIYHGKNILSKHRKTFFVIGGIVSLITLLSVGLFHDRLSELILRKSSTDGHALRMENGMRSFLEHPLGQGLATAGPAYRYVSSEGFTKKEELQQGNNKKLEDNKIPESWHIQILMEGGIFGFAAFITFLLLIAYKLIKYDTFLFVSWTSIVIMAVFLHIYEATFVALLLSIFVGLKLGHIHMNHRK
ncbi:MAG: O-antigen ligase family protein [Candidatus Gracilibacteria bacterium]